MDVGKQLTTPEAEPGHAFPPETYRYRLFPIGFQGCGFVLGVLCCAGLAAKALMAGNWAMALGIGFLVLLATPLVFAAIFILLPPQLCRVVAVRVEAGKLTVRSGGSVFEISLTDPDLVLEPVSSGVFVRPAAAVLVLRKGWSLTRRTRAGGLYIAMDFEHVDGGDALAERLKRLTRGDASEPW